MALTTTFHYSTKHLLKDTFLRWLMQDLKMDGQIVLMNVLTGTIFNVYNIQCQSGLIHPNYTNTQLTNITKERSNSNIFNYPNTLDF